MQYEDWIFNYLPGRGRCGGGENISKKQIGGCSGLGKFTHFGLTSYY